MTGNELSEFGLPQVFSPAGAAKILRDLGLTEMTECALRTRAYRKQVPFHLNGRRITFTLGDLKEIAEGEACRPQLRVTRGPRQGRRPGRAAITERPTGTMRHRRTRGEHAGQAGCQRAQIAAAAVNAEQQT